GLSNGSVTLIVPTGWTAPSTNNTNAGKTSASTGTVSIATRTITVSGVTLAAGATMTITYGDTSLGGPGTNLTASPSINVYAADGTGTLTTPTANVANGSSRNTLTFTYTAATGG